jgi:hypothetical protein
MLKLANQPDDLYAVRGRKLVTDEDDVVMLAAESKLGHVQPMTRCVYVPAGLCENSDEESSDRFITLDYKHLPLHFINARNAP